MTSSCHFFVLFLDKYERYDEALEAVGRLVAAASQRTVVRAVAGPIVEKQRTSTNK